jgi:hypothetical protein
VEGTVTATKFLLAIFETSTATVIASGTLALLAAVLTALVTLRFTRKATESQWLRDQRASEASWLRDQRARAYADLVTSFDSLASTLPRACRRHVNV